MALVNVAIVGGLLRVILHIFWINTNLFIVENILKCRISPAARTNISKRSEFLVEHPLKDSWELRDEQASVWLLDRQASLRAVDLVREKSCKISYGEPNPHAILRTGRQIFTSMSSLNNPSDISPLAVKVHTFNTLVEGNWVVECRLESSCSHNRWSPLRVSRTACQRRSKYSFVSSCRTHACVCISSRM